MSGSDLLRAWSPAARECCGYRPRHALRDALLTRDIWVPGGSGRAESAAANRVQVLRLRLCKDPARPGVQGLKVWGLAVEIQNAQGSGLRVEGSCFWVES
eukprot:2636382-Rhodomonas_salina.1